MFGNLGVSWPIIIIEWWFGTYQFSGYEKAIKFQQINFPGIWAQNSLFVHIGEKNTDFSNILNITKCWISAFYLKTSHVLLLSLFFETLLWKWFGFKAQFSYHISYSLIFHKLKLSFPYLCKETLPKSQSNNLEIIFFVFMHFINVEIVLFVWTIHLQCDLGEKHSLATFIVQSNRSKWHFSSTANQSLPYIHPYPSRPFTDSSIEQTQRPSIQRGRIGSRKNEEECL